MVVNVIGRVDAFNFDHLNFKINTLVRMGKHRLAIDLSGVRYLNLQTLRFLALTGEELEQKSGKLVLFSAPEKIRKSLRYFPAHNLIEFADTWDFLQSSAGTA